MGEFAIYNGEEIKIGTCEDMLYLRPDQIHLVRSSALSDLTSIRFRFPFPQEDKVEPGAFSNPFYGFPVQAEVPAEADSIHDKIQLKDTSNRGILVMLPCPYSVEGKASGIKYGYNGYQGPSKIVQQRAWAGVWATVMHCGACDGLYRLSELSDALPVIEALIREGDRREAAWQGEGEGRIYHEMALRVRRGYDTPVPDATLA